MAGHHPQTIRLKPTPPSASEALRQGFKFRRWDDREGDVLVKVDETGLLLSILSDRHEGVPLYISEISDVRIGGNARQPKDQKVLDALAASAGVTSFEDVGISIVHGVNMVDVSFVNLAAKQPGDAARFAQDMSKLLYNRIGTNVSEEIMLRREYARLCTLRDPDRDGIASKHLQALFEAKPKDDFRAVMAFLGWGTGSNDYVPFKEFTLQTFLRLYEDLVPMEYISDVFVKVRQAKGSKPYVTVKEFCRFLNAHHRDPRLNEILFKHLKEEEVQRIVTAMEPNKDYAKKGQLTAQGLRNYLRSKDNAIIHLSRFSQYQDMDQPLCHYYINSSHNTYLTGHQLRGKATVEIYRQVLLSGCRCIELDCWDGDDDEPVITHGKTWVNNIPFKDVIEAINECAFKASNFPLILSFENHCRFRQQRRMVAHLRGILGDKLLLDVLEDHPLLPGVPLPSPNKLLGKIICKNKLLVPKEQRGRDDGEGYGTLPKNATLDRETSGSTLPRKSQPTIEAVEVNEDVEEEASADGEKAVPTKDETTSDADTKPTMSTSTSASVLPDSDGTKKEEAGNGASNSRRESDDSFAGLPTREAGSSGQAETVLVEAGEVGNGTSDAAAGLGTGGGWCELDMPSLVNYAEPVKFKTFGDAEEINKHYQMSSFAETSGVRLVLDYPKEFIKYTQRQNCRIYPKGTRVDSSNYQPQVFWNAGCQMVSLNFQTLDFPMQLNLGKFDYNGLSGYLLKPEVMCRSDRDFDPFVESPIDNTVAAVLKVEILAGHMLSTTKDKVMVEVDMYGIPADTVRRKFKTKSVQNDVTVNFRSPAFEFKKVILPDMAILRFAVFDSQGSQLGMRILPLDGLEPGFRYVHLNNENNQCLPLSCLFVNIEVAEYIPEEMQDFALGLMDPVRYLKERMQAYMVDYDITDTGDGGDTRRSSEPALKVNGGTSQPTVLKPNVIMADAKPDATGDSSATAAAGGGTGEKVVSADRRPTVANVVLSTNKPVPDQQRSMSLVPGESKEPRRLSLFLSVTGARDILSGKDAAKQIGKINKELSSIHKKFLKTHASTAKSQASELKKAKSGASALPAAHAEVLQRMARKAMEDEENVVLKGLPALFAWATKALTARQATEVKQFDDRYKKQVAELTANLQKENAQKSHQYQEEQKKKVSDKDELQRKIREFRNKLVESVVQKRHEAERTRTAELESLEKSQATAMGDLRTMEEMEAENVRKAYRSLVEGCDNPEAVKAYIAFALEDKGLVLSCLEELP